MADERERGLTVVPPELRVSGLLREVDDLWVVTVARERLLPVRGSLVEALDDFRSVSRLVTLFEGCGRLRQVDWLLELWVVVELVLLRVEAVGLLLVRDSLGFTVVLLRERLLDADELDFVVLFDVALGWLRDELCFVAVALLERLRAELDEVLFFF